MKSGPIKILHIVNSLGSGGMENGIANVARALSPEEFEIHVCCLENSGVFADRLPQPENVHVLHKPPGFSVRAVWDLNRVIRRVQPDVIHSHNLGPLIYSGLVKLLGCRRPLLHGDHHLLTPEECVPRRRRQRAGFYRCCRKIHTVSEGLRQQLISLGLPASKIITLRNGVDCARFQPGKRAAARKIVGCLPESALVLGLVGRFAPGKGHTLLLEAFGQLAVANPRLQLLLIGAGGSEEARVQALAQASPAAERIHFTGFQNDLLPYYQALDAMVFPSVVDGLSNAVLEAMACGVPVFAQPTCGNPEIITPGRDGVLASLKCADDLVALLQPWLVSPEKLAVLGRAAREKVLTQFALETMVAQYREIYRTLADGAPD